MTVETEVSSAVFTGIVDGVALNIPFPVQATTELKVRYGILDTLAVEGVHYTVALVPPDYLTATVTPIVGFAATSGGTVSVRREVPYTQPTDIPTLTTLANARLEQMFDRVVFICQQLRDALTYSLKFPTTDVAANIASLPPAADRALMYLAFDALGKPIAAAAPVPMTTPFTAFGISWVALANASTALDALGLSAYFKTLVAAANAGALQTLLGISTFVKTILDDADAASVRTTIGAASAVSVTALMAATGEIKGWTYQNGTDTVNDLNIAAGAAMDDTGIYLIVGTAKVKQLDAVWALGTNAGMLDTGAAGNFGYDLYAIARSDTNVTDYLAVKEGDPPLLPASYDYKRKIGWFKRVGGTIVQFKTYEAAGGGLRFVWSAPTLDINLANTLTTARRTDALKVPLFFSVTAKARVFMADAGSNFSAWVGSTDEADVAPSVTVTPLCTIISNTGVATGFATLEIDTSAAGLIAARADLATVDLYNAVTLSFVWGRR